MSTDVNEPVVRQLKLSNGEEIIGYVSNFEKGTVQFDYPLQVLSNLQQEVFTFKPWWSVNSPITTCIVNTQHIIATHVPDAADIELYNNAINALVNDYEKDLVTTPDPNKDRIH